MLELKNITKEYGIANEKIQALKGISIKFRESEFVSILGQSGCGKTTLLNIIGGLDRYTTGDLIINGKSTKNFKDRDWDAYRNYKVGFVFQSYNLISHQTILSNVELALTIGGIPKKDRRERAIKALEEVGLKEHINKRPNQLSGGQMQRVAIARALVNNPDIILADEPTGALDTKTSVQVMEILKKISKDKLIIMVTHNPELAEQYSSRIIRILDGVITEDSNPIKENETQNEGVQRNKIGRTSMKFWTAFRLSLNNLLTKKTRTILIAFAGSIGIIGIALVQAISNGFQGYIDHIQEETLTSYPLIIRQETTDVASALLAMTGEENNNEDGENVKEEQYISKMLASLSTNDLRSFKEYLNNNINTVRENVSNIEYMYSVAPLIYTVDATEKLAKLNPSNLFSAAFGGSAFGSSMLGSYSSIYSQMISDKELLNSTYDVLAGRWPEKYDEMIIVLSERNGISDLLVYSLGLRDTEELKNVVTKIMSGEKVEVNNEPLNLTYNDLLNITLKLIMPTSIYKYNEQYDIYEDMSDDNEYMMEIYNNAIPLKIVGIVSAKEGVTSMALNPGVAYTSDLINYVIDNSKNNDMVKKQLENEEIDVLSGVRFDEKKSKLDLDFTDLISVDTSALQNSFNIDITPEKLQDETKEYMGEIIEALNVDNSEAKDDILNNLKTMASNLFKTISDEISVKNTDDIVENYLNGYDASKRLSDLENKYTIPKDTFKAMYSGLLKGLLVMYINLYNTASTIIGEKANSNAEATPQSEITPSPSEQQSIIDNITENAKNIGNAINNIRKSGEESFNNLKENISNTITNMNLPQLQSQGAENTQNSNENLSTEQPGLLNNLQEKAKEIISDVQNSMANTTVKVNQNIAEPIILYYTNSLAVKQTSETMSDIISQAVMRKNVITKITELMGNLTNSIASSFDIDQEKIAGAFKMNMTEDEITRLVNAMMSKNETNAKTNLINLGYQDKDEPAYISFYFKSFDGKENFMSFIENYNENVKKNGEEEKEINYSDTTGILMGSVKTIVNAVTYVLIAFISISLVVSSIMIGIITYISVYERTKEIGILRAIGASKRNISSIFNAETFIIGLLSGLFGIGVTYLSVPLINGILHHFAGNIPLNATFYPHNAIVLVVLSIILTLIGGLIPAKTASKKDPVIALRTE